VSAVFSGIGFIEYGFTIVCQLSLLQIANAMSVLNLLNSHSLTSSIQPPLSSLSFKHHFLSSSTDFSYQLSILLHLVVNFNHVSGLQLPFVHTQICSGSTEKGGPARNLLSLDAC
jgi:hypothetical protein